VPRVCWEQIVGLQTQRSVDPAPASFRIALYEHAFAAATKVAGLDDNGRSLVTRIRKDQQAVSEILYDGERGLEQAQSEELEKVGQ